MGASRIEQIIDEIYDFVESCKPQTFSQSKVIVPKDELYDLLDELKLRTPDEIKRYQKIIANRDSIIADAEEKAKALIEDAKRETDTMPNWAGSSWYWLRYCDPHNSEKLADFEKLKYWGQVDCYTGGSEHISRHILYSFFWQNFLYEIGVVPTRDPFVRKMCSGLILDNEGKKMSKSSTNGVSPTEVVEKYGADVTRMHVHFLGGYEDNTPWTYDGITGIVNFLNKVWSLQDMIKGDGVSEQHKILLNQTIKKVGENLENLKLNTAISSLMIFIKKVKEDGFITRDELKQFLVLLNPLAPHLTSELFEVVFKTQILDESWPEFDEKFLTESEIEIPFQINGKVKKVIKVKKDAEQDEVLEEIGKQTDIDIWDPKKIIFVKNRIINIIK